MQACMQAGRQAGRQGGRKERLRESRDDLQVLPVLGTLFFTTDEVPEVEEEEDGTCRICFVTLLVALEDILPVALRC